MTFHAQIATAIINKLNGSAFLNGVYLGEVAVPTQGMYPFATVSLKHGEAKFGDTIRNDRLFEFRVNVYQERTKPGQGPQTSEQIVIGFTDEVITAFDADTTLSGLVSMVKPISFDATYVTREIGDTRILEFTIEGRALVPSS
jgi:hypothetical protein